MTRSGLERQIGEDELALDAVVELLTEQTQLSQWPADASIALALALDDPSASAGEQWKAAALRRHLFGAGAPPVFTVATATAEDRSRAARLRSGLVARVRLHAGRYL